MFKPITTSLARPYPHEFLFAVSWTTGQETAHQAVAHGRTLLFFIFLAQAELARMAKPPINPLSPD
jgi:hypothetical protein